MLRVRYCRNTQLLNKYRRLEEIHFKDKKDKSSHSYCMCQELHWHYGYRITQSALPFTPIEEIPTDIPFLQKKKGRLQKSSDLPKATQLVRGQSGDWFMHCNLFTITHTSTFYCFFKWGHKSDKLRG